MRMRLQNGRAGSDHFAPLGSEIPRSTDLTQSSLRGRTRIRLGQSSLAGWTLAGHPAGFKAISPGLRQQCHGGRYQRVVQMWRQREALLLQKVVTDCPGDFLWGLFVDPKVVKSWEFLRFCLR